MLNGNGVTGSAGTASYLLSQRGYQIVSPPDGKNSNAPNWDYFKTQDRLRQGAGGRGGRRQQGREALRHGRRGKPHLAAVEALSNGAVLTVIVGPTFHGTLAGRRSTRRRSARRRTSRRARTRRSPLLLERAPKVPFTVMVPTVLERTSWIDRERPVRMYRINPEGEHKTIRLTYRTGGAPSTGASR